MQNVPTSLMFEAVRKMLSWLHIRKPQTWVCGVTHHQRYECMGVMTMIHKHMAGRAHTSILDAGCSDGTAAKYCMSFLRELNHKVSLVGVDQDKRRIKNAQKDSNEIKFICTDIRQLEFKNQFDIVICLNVIRYIDAKSKKEILQKISRMLKPDGMLVTGINKCDMKLMNLPVLEPPSCPRHNWLQRWVLQCKRPLGAQNDTRMISRKKVEEYANLCI